MPTTVKQPPHNLEAEEAVVASLLVLGEGFQEHPVLTPADFHNEKLAWIYEAIYGLGMAGKPHNEVIVAQELNRLDRLEKVGGMDYLTKLITGCPDPFLIDHYVIIVKELSLRRQLISLAGSLAREAHDESMNIDSVLAHNEGAFNRICTEWSRFLHEEDDDREIANRKVL